MNQKPNNNGDEASNPSNLNSSSNLTLKSITTQSGFTFPSIYSFPPFFTKQPNPTTWSHQSSLWQDLIKSYCKFHRLYKFELSESTIDNSELFNNRSISRKINLETLIAIIDSMIQTGQAEYHPNRPVLNQANSSKGPNYALIYFDSISNWSKIIYDYVLSNGLTNSIMTLNELTEIDDQLIGLDPIILRKALNLLVKQNKAKIFKGSADGIGGDNEGVKFF